MQDTTRPLEEMSAKNIFCRNKLTDLVENKDSVSEETGNKATVLRAVGGSLIWKPQSIVVPGLKSIRR